MFETPTIRGLFHELVIYSVIYIAVIVHFVLSVDIFDPSRVLNDSIIHH